MPAYQVHSHVKKQLSCVNAQETHGITNLSNLLLELFVKGLSFFYVPLHQESIIRYLFAEQGTCIDTLGLHLGGVKCPPP